MLTDLLKKVANQFNINKIPYMVIGGQALLLYSQPRFTNDIDITLGLDIDNVDYIIQITDKINLKPLPDNPSDFVNQTMVLPMVDTETERRVDLIFSFTEYENDAISRANRYEIDNIQISYASPEDLIVMKIISGRQIDLEDVKNILLQNPHLNKNLIINILNEFGKFLNIDFTDTFIKIVNSCSLT